MGANLTPVFIWFGVPGGLYYFSDGIFSGACNYPVEVNEPVGTVLRWNVNAADEQAVVAINRLPWLQEDQLLVKESNINGKTTLEYTLTVPVVKKDILQTYRKNLEKIAGVQNLAVLPVTHQTSQPLYAAAMENLLRIEMDATNISDAELKKSIEMKLQQQGLPGVNINIIHNASGQRMIVTKLPEKPGKDYGFDLTLKDGKQPYPHQRAGKNETGQSNA